MPPVLVPPSTALASDLAAMFTPESAIVRPPPRMALSIEALDKCGKSHWAIMTAPGPIAVVTNDPGTQTIIDKARASGKIIHQFDMNFDPPRNTALRKESDTDAQEVAAWVAEWNRYSNFIWALQKDKGIRTYVSDTETTVFQLCELAHFGKLMGNARQDKRTTMNAAYSALFWGLYNKRPDLNIILIHQLKKKYAKTGTGPNAVADWDGKSFESTGYNKVGFFVDATIRLGWDPVMKDFYSEMDQTKSFRFYSREPGLDNSAALSKRWFANDPNDPSAFWNLGFELLPQTVETPEVWGI